MAATEPQTGPDARADVNEELSELMMLSVAVAKPVVPVAGGLATAVEILLPAEADVLDGGNEMG